MNKKTKVITLYAILMTSVFLMAFAPGTAQDPLISLSRLNYEINALRSYFNARINAVESQITSDHPTTTAAPIDVEEIMNSLRDELLPILMEEINRQNQQTPNTPQTPQFTVLELTAGQTVVGDEGAKIILRGGTALVYSRVENGLADLTTGDELFHGANVPLNHYLMVSRDDGRGIMVTSGEAWVIVEGAFVLN